MTKHGERLRGYWRRPITGIRIVKTKLTKLLDAPSEDIGLLAYKTGLFRGWSAT
jgi:hypothetical protein